MLERWRVADWPAAWRTLSLARLLNLIAIGLGVFCVAQFLPLSGKSVNNVYYGLVLLPTLVLCVRYPGPVWHALRAAPALFAFFAASAALSLSADSLSLFKNAFFVAFFCLTVLVLRMQQPGEELRPFAWLAAVATAVLLIGSGQWLLDWQQQSELVRQIGWGRSSNPIYAGLLICSALLFAWHFLLEPCCRTPAGRVAGLLATLALCLLAVVVFQARSALLGLLAYLLCCIVFRGAVRLALVAVLAFSALLWVSGAYEAVLVRGLSYRPEIWQEAVSRLAQQCDVWLGCGKDEEVFLGQYIGAHSGYIGTLLRHGVVGAVAFAIFAVWYVVRGVRARSDWFLVSLVGWGGMVTAMDGFIGSPNAWWVFFWYPTAAAIAECTVPRAAAPEDTPSKPARARKPRARRQAAADSTATPAAASADGMAAASGPLRVDAVPAWEDIDRVADAEAAVPPARQRQPRRKGARDAD